METTPIMELLSMHSVSWVWKTSTRLSWQAMDNVQQIMDKVNILYIPITYDRNTF
jgi:hypothetical protein